ncbi:CPBP family glutamic-type intramembrane protease [Nannocystis poenicansa]|uniref:CPBP family glutamic-type intramembrane protease n=1 Tax=Nannocystis punicea TaxID=2995304 RepID=A0ABY7HL81_9BACT|nr:CPBP family glutamic-type intramembrane protease [Nannocystis poenicansa]
MAGAAVLFGALHLPAAAQVWPLTHLVVARTLLLNALPGALFGAIYVRRGLEHAIVMHFAADIALHVVLPAVMT